MKFTDEQLLAEMGTNGNAFTLRHLASHFSVDRSTINHRLHKLEGWSQVERLDKSVRPVLWRSTATERDVDSMTTGMILRELIATKIERVAMLAGELEIRRREGIT